jgi:hypothetical protein
MFFQPKYLFLSWDVHPGSRTRNLDQDLEVLPWYPSQILDPGVQKAPEPPRPETENERFGLVIAKTGFINSGPKRSFSVIETERFGVFSRKLGL